MTALRTTRPAEFRPLRLIGRVWVVLLAAPGVFGCGTASSPPADPQPAATTVAVGTNDPDWLTSRSLLPPPSTDRIDYDAQQRVLTFYELPGQDHWVVQLPDEPGRPVGPRHRLPEGIDTASVRVYYTRPGAKTSMYVTVAQIDEAGRAAHTSKVLRDGAP